MRKWTDEQKEAIFYKWRDDDKTLSSNILVNAAAGSGKTAVLVERIINKLCADPDSPDYCDISSILVVTFTNAAAKEMKQRISDALNNKFSDAVNDNDMVFAQHLKKQIKMINSADITTIDSFCLKIVRNYFHLINIDPDFRIADSAECELLKDEVMEELFDEEYSNESFINLAFMLTDGRDTSKISDLIRRLFNFSRSLPDYDKWMQEKKEQLLINDENNIWFQTVKNKINQEAEYASTVLKEALSKMINLSFGCSDKYQDEELLKIITNNPPEAENELYYSFGTYYTAIYNEYIIASSISGKNWDEMYHLFDDLSFINLNSAPKFKDKEKLVTDKIILAELKDLRNNAKNALLSVGELVHTKTEEICKISREHLYPMISSIIDLCKKFEEKYSKKKNSKNVLEFYDIEHLCLKIIKEHEDIKNVLKEKYAEILIDEYQDTNALQEEIFTNISRGDNMYMVGDMKQSIYRFRSSDPQIFKEKCDIYTKDEFSKNRKIVLSKNFRSRNEILSAVNSVFKCIMSEVVGEIDYDTDQQLNLGNTDYIEKNENFSGKYKSECCVILAKNDDDDTDESLNSTQTEARFIAKKIKELKDNNFLVCDKKTIQNIDDSGNVTEEQIVYYRPIQNKDIAIIISSHKNISSIYQAELSNLGIDCYAEVGGYFEKTEITMAISLLKMINNPYNDLPLIAVMRSPLFAFSDDELCEIKLCGGGSFYNSLKIAAESGNEVLKNKCKVFGKNIDRWRSYKKIMPCDKLIWTLYEETGLYSFCESVYGEDAASNLRLLFVRARGFEESGYKGLFNFIRYIGKMQKREEDLSSAVTLGENCDVVRLMTIHKSKGLEFPVVFLAGCSKKFNTSELKEKVLFHKDFGFGADYINYESSFYDKTLQKNAIMLKMNNEIVSEEMRKLYVAMTRAKEKLYVTSVCKKSNNEEFLQDRPVEYERWSALLDINTKFSHAQAGAANRFIDWIAPVALRDNENWIFNIVPYANVSKTDLSFDEENMINKDNLPSENIIISQKRYNFEEATKIPSKISVTQVEYLNQNSYSDLINKPEFLSDSSTVTGAKRGTAVHYVMQKFIPDANISKDSIEHFIRQLVNNEELTQSEADSIDPLLILDFYSSELGQRVLKSDKVFREAPFEIELPLKDITSSDSCEKIILQGIIDCYFYEGNEIVLVDYKTDCCTNIDEIREKYRQQIQLYKLAIEKITKKSIKNQFIYLFSSKSVVEC